MENRQSSLKNLFTRQVPGINVIQISVVEDENADQYRSRYFAFFKGVPGEQSSDSPTGRTYNYKNAVNIKVEAEKIFAIASALTICAEGKYDAYEKNFGHFEIHADSSRSSYGEGEKKNVRIGVMKNNKTQKFVITISFLADNKKAIGYLSPYEAFGFAKTLEFCASKILELESTRNVGVQVNKSNDNIPQNNFKPAPPTQASQNNTPAFSAPQEENPALGGFKEMFSPMNGSEMGDSPFA